MPLQGLAKRVAALRYHIVKDAARREDVHCAGLKRNAGCERPSADDAPHSAVGRTVSATSSTWRVFWESWLTCGTCSEPCWAPCRCRTCDRGPRSRLPAGSLCPPCASVSSNVTGERQCAPRGVVVKTKCTNMRKRLPN